MTVQTLPVLKHTELRLLLETTRLCLKTGYCYATYDYFAARPNLRTADGTPWQRSDLKRRLTTLGRAGLIETAYYIRGRRVEAGSSGASERAICPTALGLQLIAGVDPDLAARAAHPELPEELPTDVLRAIYRSRGRGVPVRAPAPAAPGVDPGDARPWDRPAIQGTPAPGALKQESKVQKSNCTGAKICLELAREFGLEAVEQAVTECERAGREISREALLSILRPASVEPAPRIVAPVRRAAPGSSAKRLAASPQTRTHGTGDGQAHVTRSIPPVGSPVAAHTLDDLIQALTPCVGPRSIDLVRKAYIAAQPGVVLDQSLFDAESRRFIQRLAPYVQFQAVAA